MDPLSIVASVIAIAQAGDRLIQLMAKMRPYFKAFGEIDALIDELCDLKLVLDTAHIAVSNLPQGYITGLAKALDTCNRAVLDLEKILTESSRTTSMVKSQIHRVRWWKSKNKVESLRQRLRDSKSTLTLHLLAVNP